MQMHNYLTIIPRARVGYEMIDSQRGTFISYPTSASGIIVLLKTPPKYRKLDYNKNKKAQKITQMLAMFVDHRLWLITHDGLADQNSRIALSNDPVFNNSVYTIAFLG